MILGNIDKIQMLATKMGDYALVRQELIGSLGRLDGKDKTELKDVINTVMLSQMSRLQKEISEL